MGDRKFEGSLSAQTASLKKTMQNRTHRRNSDRNHRLRSADEAAAPAHPRKPASNATGGIALGSGSSLLVGEPRIFRCTLCQISFKSLAEEQQHVNGPTHRKALAKQQAELEQSARLSKGRSAAQSAVAAAQWHAPSAQCPKPAVPAEDLRQVSAHPGSSAGFGQKSEQHRQHQHQKKANVQAAPVTATKITHADMVAQLRRHDETMSVGGWVPPGLAASEDTRYAVPSSHPQMIQQSQQPEPYGIESQQESSSAQGSKTHAGSIVQTGLVALQDYGSDSDSGSYGRSGSDSDSQKSQQRGNLGPFF